METLKTFLNDSTFFYVFLTLITYGFGVMLKNKFKHPVFNPLLISTALCIAVILIFKLDAAKYKQGTKFISFLLTPVTVCLAIPLYEQFEKLKDNWLAILLGIISGVVTSLSLVFGMCLAFGFSYRNNWNCWKHFCGIDFEGFQNYSSGCEGHSNWNFVTRTWNCKSNGNRRS